MKSQQAVVVLLGMMVLMGVRAEVGYTFGESVEKHGKPVAQLDKADGATYIFSVDGANFRETYSKEGLCVESDFAAPASTKLHRSEPHAPDIAVHVETVKVEVARRPHAALTAVVIVLVLSSFVSLLMLFRLRRKTHDRDGAADGMGEGALISSPRLYPVGEYHPLSKNEMWFYKALSQAVGDRFLIMSHVPLGKVIDVESALFEDHVDFFQHMLERHVDFVLHDAADMRPRAAIVLHERSEDAREKNRREKFLHHVLEEQGITFLRIDARHQYSVEDLISQISGMNHLDAA